MRDRGFGGRGGGDRGGFGGGDRGGFGGGDRGGFGGGRDRGGFGGGDRGGFGGRDRGGFGGGDRGGFGGRDRGGFGGGGGGYGGGGDDGGFRPRRRFDEGGEGGGGFGGGEGGYRPRPPVERGPRQNGVVKFFNAEKGYGFITPEEGGADVFVHVSAVERSGVTLLDKGQKVSFETEPDKRGKGPKAVNLQILEGGAPASSEEQPDYPDEE